MASPNKAYSKPKQNNKKLPESWIEALKGNGEIVTPENQQTKPEKAIHHLDQVKKQEKEIYSREQRETREKIKQLQQQIEKLTNTSKSLKQELHTAAEQPIVNPGKSDISFLESLIRAIKRFREKIEDSSIWLKTWNQKKQKKGPFWSKVQSKKGGAQFLLSSEHSASRSAG